MSTKEARSAVLAALRTAMPREETRPDPGLDVSDFVVASMELGVKSVTWDLVKMELERDKEFKDLSDWILGGCEGPPGELLDHIKQYWRVKNSLRVVERVLMMGERTVVPWGLRDQVLETLHSAHQGVLSMGLRAEDAVYWPGLWADIKRVRARCSTCAQIAPSQAKLPPVEPLVPNYPFEHVCVDYMSLNGWNYGVFVDRYTG